jgi:TldD protein
MHDRLSSRLMGLKPTGNGRRSNFECMPILRMTNTGMLGGNTPREAMIASTRRGLYCAQLGSGQVDITNGKFIFQCTEAYLIENGKITTPVKGATLIGVGQPSLKITGLTVGGTRLSSDPLT